MNLIDRVDVILVEPGEGGNVGSAARALKNMGFASFQMVRPLYEDPHRARMMSVHAADVLQASRVHQSLTEAISGANWVVGVSGRRRTHPDRKPPIGPDVFVEKLKELPEGSRCALVFGSEKTGLTNEQLGRCHDILGIPTSEAYTSMNLAQAVMLVAWEIRRADLDSLTPEVPGSLRKSVTAEALEGLIQHAAQTLRVLGYLNEQNPTLILDDLRKVFARAGLDPRELAMLRGIFHRMDVWVSEHGGPPTPNQQRKSRN